MNLLLLKIKFVRVKDTDKLPIVIVGNKYDLENERQVQNPEGDNLSKTWRVPFFKTSAKALINVEEAFFWISKRN